MMPYTAFRLTPSSSIECSLIPFLLHWLRKQGYALVSHDTSASEGEIERELLALMLLPGRHFASRAAYTTLQGQNDTNSLPAHTESIYSSTRITPYFALGCVCPAVNGGETRVFDARKAGQLLQETHPRLSTTLLRYTSTAYPEESSEYPLICRDTEYGEVLRYRAKTKDNVFTHIPHGYIEDDVYRIVNDVLSQCVILSHSWVKGDILFVNNKITLHDRMPYRGLRVMLRVRFDDPQNTKLTY